MEEELTGVVPWSVDARCDWKSWSYRHALTGRFEDAIESAVNRLGVELPAAVMRSVKKRRIEFMLGRYCAKQACRDAGFAHVGAIPINPDRSPAWPAGVVGSITHCDGFVGAVAAPTELVRAVGLDAENIIREDIFNDVRDDIADPNEWALALGHPELSPPEFLTLVFSAKESVFKCLYPVVRRRFYFHDIELEGLDVGARLFRFRLLTDLHPEFRAGRSWSGQFLFREGRVQTLVEIPGPLGRTSDHTTTLNVRPAR